VHGLNEKNINVQVCYVDLFLPLFLLVDIEIQNKQLVYSGCLIWNMSNLSCRNVILQDSLNLWLLLNALTSTQYTFSIISTVWCQACSYLPILPESKILFTCLLCYG
jgi:hypothetical protein